MRKAENKQQPLSDEQVGEMISTLRAQARAQFSLERLVEEQENRKVERAESGRTRPDDDLLELGAALWAARRITRDEFAHIVSFAVEGVNEKRLGAGKYKAEIEPLEVKMRAIEKAEGLGPGQYWMKGDAPEEYAALTDAWEAVVHRHFGEILVELGFEEFAELWINDRAEWDRIVEVGRQLFHQKAASEPIHTVEMLVASYEAEADLCEGVGAYYAGCVMLGAAAEARLLQACLADPQATEAARGKLPKENRPKRLDPHSWTLEQLIGVASAAGWIGELEDTDFVFSVSGLANRLRATRNFLHPGRHAVDRPLSAITAHEYRDAKASYYGLRLNLEPRPRGPKIVDEPAR